LTSSLYQKVFPRAPVTTYLEPDSLSGYDNVVVIGDGLPGSTTDQVGVRPGQRPGTRMTGAELGALIKNSGFKGKRILLHSCNGGTDPAVGNSTAQDVANVTGADVTSARVDDGQHACALANTHPDVRYKSDLMRETNLTSMECVEPIEEGQIVRASDVDSDLLPPGATDDIAVQHLVPGDVGKSFPKEWAGGAIVHGYAGDVIDTGSVDSSGTVATVAGGTWHTYTPAPYTYTPAPMPF
jgi:hypothetical protein